MFHSPVPVAVMAVVAIATLFFPSDVELLSDTNNNVQVCASLLGTRDLTPMASIHAFQHGRKKLGLSLSLMQYYRHSPRFLLCRVCLLMLSGDIETNHGPRQPKFPCGECNKAVTWSTKRLAVACDDCNTRYHVDCLQMYTASYNAVAQPDVSWHCCSCGTPHFSSSLFDSTQYIPANSSSPSTSDSQCSSFCDIPVDAATPLSTSSPTKPAVSPLLTNSLRILVLNFFSLPAKRELFWNAVDTCNPDIVLGCETWLKPSVHNS